jgi:hypothetical protein
LDLAELHQFEQARDLSIELLKNWLSKYKFKNWAVTQTRQLPVTLQMREKRAAEIAELLNKNERWHSHGRGIPMAMLAGDEFKLKIEDYSLLPCNKKIRDYYELLVDYMNRQKLISFVHTTDYF